MKIIIACLLFLLLAKLSYGDGISSHLNIKSQDGAVNTYPYQVRFSTGSLTDNGDGTVSVLVSTFSGSGGGAVTLISSGVAFGSPSNTVTQDTNTFTFDNTAKTLSVSTISATAGVLSTLNVGTHALVVSAPTSFTNVPPGTLDVIRVGSSAGDPLFSVGSTNLINQFVVPDITRVFFSLGIRAGAVQLGLFTDDSALSSANDASQEIVYWDSNWTMRFKTGVNGGGGAGQNEFAFMPLGVEKMRLTQVGNLGIGTSVPTNILSLASTPSQTFWMERSTTTNTPGNNLTVQAGGAATSATNQNGGNLILSAGTATGTGTSQVSIQVSTGTTAGTGDSISSVAITFVGAPPNGQALCLSNNQLGHCTSVVGISGSCTCSVP